MLALEDIADVCIGIIGTGIGGLSAMASAHRTDFEVAELIDAAGSTDPLLCLGEPVLNFVGWTEHNLGMQRKKP